MFKFYYGTWRNKSIEMYFDPNKYILFKDLHIPSFTYV